MARELVIKNRIDALNLVLPNAKVGENYSQLIKIDDPDVCEYWLEGLEDTGLYAESEVILNPIEIINVDEGNDTTNVTSSDKGIIDSMTPGCTDCIEEIDSHKIGDVTVAIDTKVLGTKDC